jgi:hypothetical protein
LGEAVLRGAWGSGPGAFGHTGEAEANPEGPMAVAVTSAGRVDVLDPRNGRVLRFVDGRVVGAVGPIGEATQDLAHTADGRVVTLDRLGAATVTVFDREGHPRATIPLRGGPVTEGGAVTAVFADADGVYVEHAHREVVRVADADGREDPARPTLWGRPSRDGAQLLRAAIEDRARGTVRVTVASRENGAVDWSSVVPLGASVLHLVMLDGDHGGRVYVAAVVGVFAAEVLRDPALVVLRLDRAGAVDGALRLPPLAGGDEVFRPVCIDDAGAVYVMDLGAEGLTVRRYTFAG